MTTNVLTRTSEEVFNHHMDAFLRKDFKELASDFTDESILISSAGTKAVGANAITEAYRELIGSFEEGTTFAVKQVIMEGDVVFLEWTSDSPSSAVKDGVDTNVIRDGKIVVQTVRYLNIPKN